MDRLLDISEVAKLLHVKPSTIYAWVHQDFIPHFKIGRLVRFSEEKVMQWVRKKEHKGRLQRIPEVTLKK